MYLINKLLKYVLNNILNITLLIKNAYHPSGKCNIKLTAWKPPVMCTSTHICLEISRAYDTNHLA